MNAQIENMFARPDHLFLSDDGGLYDTRNEGWASRAPLRRNYCRHHTEIKDTHDLRATLRAGEFVWPGGYRIALVCSDGELLSFGSAKDCYEMLSDALVNDDRHSPWFIIGTVVVDHLDSETQINCAHSGECLWAPED